MNNNNDPNEQIADNLPQPDDTLFDAAKTQNTSHITEESKETEIKPNPFATAPIEVKTYYPLLFIAAFLNL